MFSLRGGACIAVICAAAAVLPGVAAAQVVSPASIAPAPQDVFASVHESLNDAADRTLATALADRPWMKSPAAAPADAEPSSTYPTNDLASRVRAAVARVHQLRPLIEPILRQEGVPPGLSAVVLVESGGLPMALSPKGARGLWQFMPYTARRYGLVVSPARDDRLDIAKSTRAAARYLRDLYRQFGDWQLALAAYNAGAKAVYRAAAHLAQKDFSAVAATLPAETRAYVPAVLKAISTLDGSAGSIQQLQSQPRNVGGRVLYAPLETN